MGFENKVVLITGAGSGIGRAIALEFARLSAKLCLLDINAVSLSEVAEHCERLTQAKVLNIVADVTKYSQTEQVIVDTIKEYQRLDVVVNCAGIGFTADILNPKFLDVFDKVIEINLKSSVAMTHFAAPELIKTEGCVINISSVYSSMVDKNCIAYTTSKAGLTHFTKNAALELADKGVRVNCIAPGYVETNLIKNSGASEEEMADVTASIKPAPLKHKLKVDEIAALSIFLASDKAKSITGGEYLIDSGYSLLRTLRKD